MQDLLLKNARLIDQVDSTDVLIHEGEIVFRGNYTGGPVRQLIDLKGRLLLPGFIDPHVHLDIAMINSREYPGRITPFTSQRDMIVQMEKQRQNFTREDIETRASTALEQALRHGVTAVRAQCHIDPIVRLKHLEVLLAVKQHFKGRLDLQIVAFPQQRLVEDPGLIDLFREALSMGADVMGCAGFHDRDVRAHIDAAFKLAMEFDVDLDCHADLALQDHIPYEDFEIVYIARKTIELGYHGRVTAGHLCALDSATPDTASKVIDRIREAGINVISLPDMYRLGRQDQQHVRRGLTRVKSMLQAGINVTYASNNVRDVLRPFGNFNPLEEGLILAYGAHMDTVDELNTLVKMSTFHAARALNLENYGTSPGCKADLVVLEAPTAAAAMIGQVEKRYIFKGGRLMAANQVLCETYFQTG